MAKPTLVVKSIWIFLFIFWVVVIGLVLTNETVRQVVLHPLSF